MRITFVLVVATVFAVVALFAPVLPTFTPGSAFPASSNGPLNILTVTPDFTPLVQVLTSDSKIVDFETGETPGETGDPVDSAISAAEAFTGTAYNGRVPTIEGIEGSSLGLPLAISAWSDITGSTWTTPTAATGTVDDFGNVFRVRGVQAKSVLAQSSGDELLLVPQGSVVSSAFTGQVVFVKNLAEAVAALCQTPGAVCPSS